MGVPPPDCAAKGQFWNRKNRRQLSTKENVRRGDRLIEREENNSVKCFFLWAIARAFWRYCKLVLEFRCRIQVRNRWFSCNLGRHKQQWWNEQMLVDKQSELMSDLLFTVHQHGGDDVTWKPPIECCWSVKVRLYQGGCKENLLIRNKGPI